jgi:hypothetical protein
MRYFWSKAFFNTVDWWGICSMHWAPSSAPQLKKKMAYCPKARSLGLVWVNEFNIEKKFKELNLLVLILNWTYVVFDCLACNLLQISPLKLFLKMCPQNARNAISGSQILKPSLANRTRLTPSAIVYHLRGGQGENGPFGNFAPPWRILKKCTVLKDFSIQLSV